MARHVRNRSGSNRQARRRRACASAIGAGLLLIASAGHAQVQRSFINLGFEQPALAPNACFIITSSANVPGWETTHPSFPRSGNCTTPVGSAGPSIELWRNLNGVGPRAGLNHAELNAFQSSRIYQSVCLAAGEVVDWRLSHRGRSGVDVMSFNINSSANQIVRTSTNQAGAGNVVAGSCGSGSVGSATCNAPATVGTWADYSGSFTWNGASGEHDFGFEAISAAGGVAAGNFLDEITVILRPYIEFFPATASTVEGQGASGVPAIRVTGIIMTAFDVQVQITGGNAVLGTDYSAPGTTMSVTIPAGDYGTGQDFPLPLAAIDDDVVEDNETVTLVIVDDPANYVVASTTVCGGTANSALSWSLVDNDVDLTADKQVDDDTPVAGTPFEYTVTFSNNTARPTVAPLDAHDVTATVEDLVPAGLSFDSWTCQAGNGASCPGGAVDGSTSGSGPISGSASLPAGAGAAGGTLTYTITASLDGSQSCTDIDNTATIATPAGFGEGNSADPGFTTPVPGGTANNSAQVGVGEVCADLAIVKTVAPDDVEPGDTVVYTLEVSNNGPDAADGAVVTDPGVPGSLDCTALTCSAGAGAACPGAPTPAQLAAGLAIPTFPVGGTVTLELTCTVTASGTP